MRGSKTRLVIAVSLILVLCYVALPSMVDPDQEARAFLVESEDVLIEAQPLFSPSDTLDNYVDSRQSITHGTDTNPPPSGMGELSGYTSLEEESYPNPTWTRLLTQTTFTTRPSGWTDDGISYAGGYFVETSSITGYIYCTGVDTSGCDQVRFTLGFQGTWETSSVSVWFWDSSSWVLIDYFNESPTYGDQSFSNSSSIFKHSGFRVKVQYDDFDSTLDFQADNWRIDRLDTETHYRFEAVYKFTGVDFSEFASEELYIDFASGSSTDTLEFRVEAGDTTPDNLVTPSPKNTDFHVDIHPYLTGSEFYVDIRDTWRSGDSTQSEWRIERLYIRLSENNPVSDSAPLTTGLVDGSHILAEYDYVTTSVYVSDPGGYADITQVILSVYDQSQSTQQFSLVYAEDGNVFAEGNSSELVILDAGGSSATKAGNDIDLEFRYAVEFLCPWVENAQLRVQVFDSVGETNPVSFYSSGFHIESRLALDGLNVDDGLGTPNRGDIDSTLQISGALTYYGMSSHYPLSGSVDISVTCGNISGSPWAPSDYNQADGTFSVSVPSDSTVGRDYYSLSVICDGLERLHTGYSIPYISDEVICASLSSSAFIVDSSETGFMEVQLQYAYDGQPVLDGNYSLGSVNLTHQSGNVWNGSYAPNALMKVTFDSITLVSNNSLGVTGINMNGSSLDIYWERLVCYVTGPANNTFLVGHNATGIHVSAEYYFWADHGNRQYNGSLLLNDTNYAYGTAGTRGYRVESASGDPDWGVFTIESSTSILIIWEDETTTSTDTTTTTTPSTTTGTGGTGEPPPDLYWLVFTGVGSLALGLIVLGGVYRMRRRSGKVPGTPTSEEHAELETALDYLDMISDEKDPDHEDKT